MGYTELSEEDLVKMSQQGDELALDHLIKSYQGLLYFLCAKYFLKDGDKEDLFQEATIGLIEAAKAYNPANNKKFRNFAVLCITRELDSCVKRSNRKKHQILNDAIPIYSYAENEEEKSEAGYQSFLDRVLKDDSLCPEKVFVEKEAISEILGIINLALSDMEKQVLKLRIKGHSYNEITLKLKLQDKSVDNAIQRIRRKVETGQICIA